MKIWVLVNIQNKWAEVNKSVKKSAPDVAYLSDSARVCVDKICKGNGK